MGLERYTDLAAFRRETLGLLCRREAENHLLLGLLDTLGKFAAKGEPRSPYMVLVRSGGVVTSAALVTVPGRPLVATRMGPEERELVAADAAAAAPVGVVGEKDSATALATTLGRKLGKEPVVAMELGVQKLERLIPPQAAPGRLRLAAAGDAETLYAWTRAFEIDARLPDAGGEVTRGVDLTIAEGRLYVWEDAGRLASMATATGATPNGIRLIAVYTPDALRGHGYATSCVAGTTAALLAQGRRFCFLFTDLANPTSNALYKRIGYEHQCDFVNVRFA
jgi:predicted GNAT family acetyltransferase